MKFKIFLTILFSVSSFAFAQTEKASTSPKLIFSLEEALKYTEKENADIKEIRNINTEAIKKLTNNPGKIKAMGGGHDGNGGDPRVSEFLGLVKDLCDWLRGHPLYGTNETRCNIEYADLSRSVNFSSRVPRVTSTMTKSDKDAVTDLEYRTVVINVDRWDDEDEIQHASTVAQQVVLLTGISDSTQMVTDYLKEKRDGTENCMQVQKMMGTARNSYLGDMSYCAKMEAAKSTEDENYKSIARASHDLEEFYPKLLKDCSHFCGDIEVCKGPRPAGACLGNQ